ncbi:two-component system regulatory protein YycI [Halobacillus rhizosphaerae]|uniref:two-component system regulatory protein YycI n=1 Tax=Halobacillus rhizosphaerae TaxID=3064889 RepID=UPI00398BA781
MQWGQIKTLFILSFLVLDLFLFQQFLNKQTNEELSTLPQETVDQKDIDFSAVPNEKAPAIDVIRASPDEFTSDNLSEIEKLDKSEQEYSIKKNRLLVSKFKDPIKIDEDHIVSQVSENIPFANQYSYWTWNKDKNALLFFQKANNRTIYYNKGGSLVIHVKDGKMVSYSAALLNIADSSSFSSGDDAAVLSARDAASSLRPALSSGDKITDTSIGYYSRVNLEFGVENGAQVFNPTWKFTVNGKKDYFVDGLQGTLLNMEEDQFIDDTISIINKNIEPSSETLKQANERSAEGDAE